MTRRTERVSELIRAELAQLLRREVTDPRVGLVTITRVDVSPDLRNARVLWSRLVVGQAPEGGAIPEADPATSAGLASAAGFLRRRLAERLATKRVPELRFVFDPSLAVGSRTLGLLREVSDVAE